MVEQKGVELAIAGTCKCGKLLIISEMDKDENFNVHHVEPLCADFLRATGGRPPDKEIELFVIGVKGNDNG
jgi:hypothetical protein